MFEQTSTGVDATQESTWELSPYYMLRVTGLPIEHLLDMRAKTTVEALEEKQHNKLRLTEIASQLVELIEAHVPLVQTDELRNKLITYKRDIFNARKPRVARKIFADALPQTIVQLMEAWERTYQKIEDLQQQAKIQFEQDTHHSREVLQKAIAHPNFLQGIPLSSQDLFPKLLKYMETPIAEHDARLRKTEYSLMSFLSRVAAKTSPFSSFTAVGLGFWKQTGSAYLDSGQLDFASHIQVNYVNVLRVLQALQKHPDIQKLLSYKLNPSLVINQGKVRLIRRTDHSITRARVFRTIEAPLSFDAHPAIPALVELFQSKAHQSLPFATIVEAMSAKIKAPADVLLKFLTQLIDLQVLEADVEIYDQTPDLLADVLQLLEQWDAPIARTVAEQLRKVQELLMQYAVVSVAKRGEILRQMRLAFDQICATINATISDMSLKLLIYDDSTLTHVSAMPTEKWDRFLEDLAAYQSVAPLFDVKFRLQSALAERFIEMYGEDGVCTNSAEFLSELSKVFLQFNRALLPSEMLADLELGNENTNIRQLNELKKQFGATLVQRMAQEEEVIFTRADMQQFHEQIPETIRRRPLSHDCFVQFGPRSELLVVNQMYVGYATFFSRFLNYFQDTEVVQQVGQQLQALFGDEIVAETSGVYGFNANLHPAYTDYELEIPTLGEFRKDAGTRQRIHLDDVSFVYDKQLDRVALVHPELGKVNVLYVATLMPRLLPFLIGVFVTTFTNGLMQNNLYLLAEAELSGEQRQEVRAYPRVRVGQVVISRKKWVIPRQRLLYKTEKESDFEFFCRVQAWREELGLPQRAFFRFAPADDSENPWLKLSGEESAAEQMKTLDLTDFKPQFIDFANPLLVKLFGKRLHKVEMGVVIDEMLPEADDLLLERDGESFVTELVIELNRISNGGKENELERDTRLLL